MNDDIVTRLRMSADLIDGFPKALAKNLFPTGWLSEAADEIERLRAERDHYKRIAEEAVSNLEQAVKLLQAFQAAVHD